MIVLTVLNTFLPSVALASVVWLGLRVFRVNAATRFWAWWAVLASLVAMLAWPEVRHSAPEAAPVMLEALPPTPVAPIEIEPSVDWLLWVAAAWGIYATYRVLRIGISYGHLRGIVRRATVLDSERLEYLRRGCGIRREARLLASHEVTSPIAVGYIHPAVILPDALSAGLTAGELDHVLLHELAHIARYDDWTKLTARLCKAVLGLHPVAAFALAQIENEREAACDDWVVSAGGNAQSYAASLTRVFELSRGDRQLQISEETV